MDPGIPEHLDEILDQSHLTAEERAEAMAARALGPIYARGVHREDEWKRSFFSAMEGLLQGKSTPKTPGATDSLSSESSPER